MFSSNNSFAATFLVGLLCLVGIPFIFESALAQDGQKIDPTDPTNITLNATTAYEYTKLSNDAGFLGLGRLAGIYKNLFGESPVATLKRF